MTGVWTAWVSSLLSTSTVRVVPDTPSSWLTCAPCFRIAWHMVVRYHKLTQFLVAGCIDCDVVSDQPLSVHNKVAVALPLVACLHPCEFLHARSPPHDLLLLRLILRHHHHRRLGSRQRRARDPPMTLIRNSCVQPPSTASCLRQSLGLDRPCSASGCRSPFPSSSTRSLTILLLRAGEWPNCVATWPVAKLQPGHPGVGMYFTIYTALAYNDYVWPMRLWLIFCASSVFIILSPWHSSSPL